MLGEEVERSSRENGGWDGKNEIRDSSSRVVANLQQRGQATEALCGLQSAAETMSNLPSH